MNVVDPGHKYHVFNFDQQDGDEEVQLIQFVKKLIVPGRIESHCGTNCQEVLRVLIDRVQILNDEVPWEGNYEIIKKLRECLLLFELRALQRKMEKETLFPEKILWDEKDGHFHLNRIYDAS